MNNSQPQNNSSDQKPAPHKGKRARALIITSLILLLIALAAFLIWWFYFKDYVSTDDAYVGGNMVEINARQKGTVIAFYTDDTDLVAEGQLLVQLDPTDYQIAFKQQLAAFALTVRQVQNLWDQVNIAQANEKVAQANLDLAKLEYANREGLASFVISKEEYEQSGTTAQTSQSSYDAAKYQLEQALHTRGTTSKQEHPQIIQAKMQLINAYIALKRCNIYAPVTGFVGRRAVQVGISVDTNTPLMSVVPLDDIWVDANYKETQLTNVRIGQPARVTADIFGDVEYEGTVLGIYPGSGSVFSLLPAQNATGNWIKIVQRVPVRIKLPCDQILRYPLRLGLSTEVRVTITDTEGPMLAQTPKKEVVGQTAIYEVPLDEINEIIAHILAENLHEEDE